MKNNILNVPFRRKREGRTHYRKRLRLLASSKLRLVVRESTNNMLVSVVDYSDKGDRVIFTVDSSSLKKAGWRGPGGNVPSAYLIGYLAGKKALKNGFKEAIVDIGLNTNTKGSRVYAAVAGAMDSGLEIPFDGEVLPSKERISGDHISNYAKALKNDQVKYQRQFSGYLKKGLNPEDIAKHFNETKVHING